MTKQTEIPVPEYTEVECLRCGAADCATDHDEEDALYDERLREELRWAREEEASREGREDRKREILAKYGIPDDGDYESYEH